MSVRELLSAGQKLEFHVKPWAGNHHNGRGLSFQFWLIEFGYRNGGLIFNIPDIEITRSRNLDVQALMVCEYFEKNNVPLDEQEVETIRAALRTRRDFVANH